MTKCRNIQDGEYLSKVLYVCVHICACVCVTVCVHAYPNICVLSNIFIDSKVSEEALCSER